MASQCSTLQYWRIYRRHLPTIAPPMKRAPVTPGFDPIIGQNREGGRRFMDEPAANYTYGNRRTRLEIPEEFVMLTGAAYFFMPSIRALRNLVN